MFICVKVFILTVSFFFLGTLTGINGITFAQEDEIENLQSSLKGLKITHPEDYSLPFEEYTTPSLTIFGLSEDSYNNVNEVSGDGRSIIGHILVCHNVQALIWIEGTGIQILENLNSGEFSSAEAINATGEIVVGKAIDGKDEKRKAVMWNKTTGWQANPLADKESCANAISGKGTVIGGYIVEECRRKACIWTKENGLQLLETFNKNLQSEVISISADGMTFIVREWERSPFHENFFIWSQERGKKFLHNASHRNLVKVKAVSADGKAVVSMIKKEDNHNSIQSKLFIYTEEEDGIHFLVSSKINKQIREAFDIDSEGKIVVGAETDNQFHPWRAFIWTEEKGMMNLNDVYSSLEKKSDESKFIFTSADGISADGEVIVGNGHYELSHNVGYRLILPKKYYS